MLIGIKSKLERIQEGLALSGTLAVIDGELDFAKTDGYIQLLKVAVGYVPTAYGKQDKKWQKYLDRISDAADSLQDANTGFTGSTKEEFKVYCERVSHVLESKAADCLEPVNIDIETSADLVPFMEKHAAAGNTRGFYYETDADCAKALMEDLMNQLNGIKAEKTDRVLDISYYLRELRYGGHEYHEHVHDALNVLISTAVYAINCCSTKKQDCCSFDTQEVGGKLEYVQSIMERTKYLI